VRPGEPDPHLTAQIVSHQLSDLLIMGPAVLVHVLLAGQPAGLSYLPAGALSRFGARAAVGRLSAARALSLFGSTGACRDVPLGVPGAGVVLGPAGPLTVTMRHHGAPQRPGLARRGRAAPAAELTRLGAPAGRPPARPWPG
jgi:hypothetical protein